MSQNRYREKLRRSLISQLESQKTNIEPFLDNVDRYISLWETAISLEEDISENGIRLENGKKNESVALLVSVNKQMGLMLDKLAITPELVGEMNQFLSYKHIENWFKAIEEGTIKVCKEQLLLKII